MMSGLRRRLLRDEAGFLLIEVLAALVLLAIMIVPLAAGVSSGADRASDVRAKEACALPITSDSAALEAWRWGPMTVSLIWDRGPTALIHLGGQGGPGRPAVVGLWVDGWFQGQFDSDENGVLEVAAADWAVAAGCEVVIRARGPDCVWGPPYRSIVPSADYEPGEDETVGAEVSTATGAIGETQTVAHTPALAKPAVGISRSDVPLAVDPLGLLFSVPPEVEGPCGFVIDDSIQSWQMEEGRALDLYF